MIIRKGYNEYLVTEKEIEIFFKDESIGVVSIDDIRACIQDNDLINDNLIDAYFEELAEIIQNL